MRKQTPKATPTGPSSKGNGITLHCCITHFLSESLFPLVQSFRLFSFRGLHVRIIWATPVAVFFTSSVVTGYIFTNHLPNPLCEHSDPLVGSTSVIVPRWIDWLHDNFSYHTEHHVFPSMNPRYFPEISRLWKQHFPERYNRVPIREAWNRLWMKDEFIQG